MMAKRKRGDGTRPAELIALSAILAVFAGLVVLMSTRDPILALIFFGIAFIVSLVGLAMLSLAAAPNEMEQRDLDEQNRLGGH
ncbi:MAG: hypothetical protein LH471_01535 [Salinibacterium sp.]|nr:hypothetical protein [Salinibacterium sp.]